MKRAAIYLRVSTDKQDTERQEQSTPKLCQQFNYQIVETYKDQAISGWKHYERPGFIRLLQDAEAGKFDVIVADAMSRLSRQDETDFFELVWPKLQRANVAIHTVKDGLIDTSNFLGFMNVAFQQNVNNQFSKNNSYQVLSGSLSKADDGRNLGNTPYGYRSVMDEPGNPKSPHHLEIDEAEAAIVRWLFDQYAYHDVPMRHLCKSLNDRGIPSPGGAQYGWQPGTVRRILTNMKYTGTQTYGKTARGRFHRNIDGKLTPHKPKPAPGKRHDTHKNPENTWKTTDGAHAAIVTREVFNIVQKKLAENRGKNRKPTGIGGYVLSSMVVCGRCGKTMYPKANHHKKRNGKIYYQCHNVTGQCGYVSVRQEWIIDRIHLMIQEGLFKQRAYESHVALLKQRIDALQVQVDAKQIAEKEQKIKDKRRKLILLDDDMIEDAQAVIREEEAQLEKLKAQLRSDVDVGELFKQQIERNEDEAKAYLDKFRIVGRETEVKDELAAAEATAGNTLHRAALLSWLNKITIFWKRTPERKCELLGLEAETVWGDTQKWPPEVANLYRSVLTQAR